MGQPVLQYLHPHRGLAQGWQRKALNINSSGIGRMAFSFRQLCAKG
jgi:hypothetical protein